MNTNQTQGLLWSTRRHFFSQCAIGLGQMALASLLRDGRIFAADASAVAGALAHRRSEGHRRTLGRDGLVWGMVAGTTRL